jgi:hypothetical protein
MNLKTILFTTALVAATTTPAMANGLKGSYVGPGITVGLNGQGAAAALVGRFAVPAGDVSFSFRPQLNFFDSFEGAVGATIDVPVARDTNVYLGGGGAFRDEQSTGVLTKTDASVAYVQVGAEYGVSERVALYLDGKVAFGEETIFVPTVGMSYRF